MFVSHTQGSRLSQTVLSSALPVQPLPQTLLPGVLSQTVMTNRDDPTSIEEGLNVLTTSLEDFLGQYNELQKLEEVVVFLEQFIRVSEQDGHVCHFMTFEFYEWFVSLAGI